MKPLIDALQDTEELDTADRDAADLESVIATAELGRRPPRRPDYAAENRALVALAQESAAAPDSILQQLAETALALCHAHSAGISLLEADGRSFRWPAVAGQWATHVGEGTPRDFGPCGTVLDRRAAQLFSHPERYFTYLTSMTPGIEEALLLPFFVNGEAVGTIWVIAHDRSCRFDAEDLRVLTSLGAFAASAYQVQLSLTATTRAHQTEHQRAALQAAQKQVLELIVQDAPLNQALEALVRTVEEQSDAGVLGSILLLGPDGAHLRHGAAPSLPPAYVAAIDGVAIGPNAGSCGTAAYSQRPVSVSEIATDPRWAPYRDLALSHGLRACWSTPILSGRGAVLGTFAMYYRDARPPAAADLRLVDVITRVAALAIERKQAEAARRESEQRYRQLVQALPSAIYTTDREGRITLYNESAAELWGRRPAIGKDLWCGSWRIYQPDGAALPLDACPMAITLREGRATRGEIVIERPDGTRRCVLAYPEPLHDVSGAVVGAVNMLVDVTEHKRAEAAVHRRTAQFETLLNEAPLGVYLIDEEFRIREVNPAARPVFGDIPNLIGRDFGEVIHLLWPKATADEVVQRFRHTLETGEPYVAPEAIEERRDRGVREYYEWQINRIPLPEGAYGVVCYFRDISQHVLARQALRESGEALKNADRRKDDFLAMLAHELRNPLAPISNAVQLMRLKTLDDPKLVRARDVIERQVAHMNRLVDDLLDVSRITRGKIKLERQRLDFREVVSQAVETARPLIEQRGQRLTVSLAPAPLPIEGDLTRLAQVVTNLLNNAAKFTEPGGQIEVRAEQEGEAALLAVRDTGIGIAPELLPHIFDLFTQADDSLDRAQGGLGIGLSLVRRLVEMHGGTIIAASAGAGRGSEFTARLPMADLGS